MVTGSFAETQSHNERESKADQAQADLSVATKDLSEALEGSVEQELGEEVRSVRVFEDF